LRTEFRRRFFTPRLWFKKLDKLNAWLLKSIADAKAHRHPELTEQTVWEVFEAERLEARSINPSIGVGLGL
jgi:hypothetical protein